MAFEAELRAYQIVMSGATPPSCAWPKASSEPADKNCPSDVLSPSETAITQCPYRLKASVTFAKNRPSLNATSGTSKISRYVAHRPPVRLRVNKQRLSS